MAKFLFFTLLFFVTVLSGYDSRLNSYPEAKEWLKDADTNGESAYNIAVLYHKNIKDDTKAIQWYKKTFKMNDKGALIDASINLANIYKKQQQYDKAIFYYKKAYSLGDMGGANGLGYFYEMTLKDNKNAELWYKKAAQQGYMKSYKNLALLNHDKGNKIESAAWYIALIDVKYPKQKIITYLKTQWNLTKKDLEKANKFQQSLSIPNHYLGSID